LVSNGVNGKPRDLLIIGGGGAGLTAGLYGSRLGLSTLLIERLMTGGQVVNAEMIENFPGFPDGISGAEIGPLLQDQATRYGLEARMSEAIGLRRDEPYWVVDTYDGQIVSKAVVAAAGSTLRKLGVPGEADLKGAGVSYCATCDGAFFMDQEVAVVGDGDSALDEALVLTEFASKVLVLSRDDRFHGQKVLQERALRHDKIEVRWNTSVDAVLGDGMVDGLSVTDLPSGETTRLDVSGVFVYVGLEPNSSLFSGLLELDAAGHVPTDIWMRTGLPGLFAAGDIRQSSAAQLVTSAGDGATAAIAAHRYIEQRDWPE
jgi:thioredoxin reductase (NADPH)